MKKKVFIITCLAVMISMVLGPLQAVGAADATWPSTPAPGNGNFTSLNGVFSPMSNSDSTFITDSNGNEVGLRLNTETGNVVGGMWSKTKMVDLAKPFSLDMQVFLGNRGVFSGDGMAFVLTGAAKPTLGRSGASVGVWGGEGSGGENPGNIADQGQKNSFAVVIDTREDEMDHHVPYSGILGSNKQYLGSGYPGLPAMYEIGFPGYHTWLSFDNDKWSPSNYADHIKTNVSNNAWHNLKIDWQPDAGSYGGELKYSLTYYDGSANNTIAHSIKWTEAQVDKIFGSSKLYLGFTSSTGGFAETHVVAIKSLVDFNTAKGDVTLKRGNETVTSLTRLSKGDLLTYNYNLAINNFDGQPWQINSITLPKGEYLSFVKADGSLAKGGDTIEIKATVGTQNVVLHAVVQDNNRSAKITDLGTVPKNGTSTVKFSVPAQVNKYAAVDQSVSDEVGKLSTPGKTGEKEFIFTNTADNSNKIQYVITSDPGTLTLEKVPGFYFEKAVGSSSEDPTVADVINGIPGQDPFPVTNNDIDPYQWLLTAGRKTPTGSDSYISIKDTRPSKPGWVLKMKLSPFTLTDGSYVLGDNGSKTGGKAEMTLIDVLSTTSIKVASIRDNNVEVVVKNMQAGNDNWDLKDDAGGETTPMTQALMSIEKTPSVRAGYYRSTATWTLANAPE